MEEIIRNFVEEVISDHDFTEVVEEVISDHDFTKVVEKEVENAVSEYDFTDVLRNFFETEGGKELVGKAVGEFFRKLASKNQ